MWTRKFQGPSGAGGLAMRLICRRVPAPAMPEAGGLTRTVAAQGWPAYGLLPTALTLGAERPKGPHTHIRPRPSGYIASSQVIPRWTTPHGRLWPRVFMDRAYATCFGW